MKQIRLGRHTITMYEGIEELPIKRYHKFNKMLLVDAGIGGDLTDVDRHIQRAQMYIGQEKKEFAKTELENLRQAIYMVQNEVSPKTLAFACLVAAIDGEPCDDISDSGLAMLSEKICDICYKDIADTTESVKKKIDAELREYFPAMFDDASEKEFYDLLQRRAAMVLAGITNGEDNAEDVQRITTELLLYSEPRSFAGNDNAEIKYDKDFEQMCVYISQALHVNPKTYTTIEFFNAYEYLNKQAKAQNKRKRP